MSDLKNINAQVRELVRTLLAMPEHSVRPANQNAPTGTMDEQFATVLIPSIYTVGNDNLWLANEAAPSTNVQEQATGMRRFMASVQFFRGDAFTKACRLGTLLGLSSATTACQAAGLGFIRASPAKNLTAVVDTYWEERGQIDVEFYVIAAESISTPTYGSFQISTTTSSTTSSKVTAP